MAPASRCSPGHSSARLRDKPHTARSAATGHSSRAGAPPTAAMNSRRIKSTQSRRQALAEKSGGDRSREAVSAGLNDGSQAKKRLMVLMPNRQIKNATNAVGA